MDSVLLAEWEDRAEQGLFRYDVTACPTQLVPGAYGFIAQCNEGRASKKRATEFRVDQVEERHGHCTCIPKPAIISLWTFITCPLLIFKRLSAVLIICNEHT